MVLDEADRMLDLGFEKEVRAIIGATPTSLTRQTVMFSATWPKDAAKLASDFLSSPLRVNIGSAELSASHTITQIVEVLEMVRVWPTPPTLPFSGRVTVPIRRWAIEPSGWCGGVCYLLIALSGIAVHVGTRTLGQSPKPTQPMPASTETSSLNFARGRGGASLGAEREGREARPAAEEVSQRQEPLPHLCAVQEGGAAAGADARAQGPQGGGHPRGHDARGAPARAGGVQERCVGPRACRRLCPRVQEIVSRNGGTGDFWIHINISPLSGFEWSRPLRGRYYAVANTLTHNPSLVQARRR